MEELVGRPEDDGTAVESPRLATLLREAAARLAAEWSQKLVEMPVQLIEDPHFRLAGAEEAIRLIVSNVEQVLRHHEPLARDIAEKAQEAHDHLRVAAGGKPREGSKLSAKTADQLVDLCRRSPHAPLPARHPDAPNGGVREPARPPVRRAARDQLLPRPADGAFADAGGGSGWRGGQVRVERVGEGGIGRVLFVSGCKDLSDAVSLTLKSFTDERMLELDGLMEQMLRERFTALVHVCLATQAVLKPLEKSDGADGQRLHRAPAAPVERGGPVPRAAHRGGGGGRGGGPVPPGRAGGDARRAATRDGPRAVELCVLAAPVGPGQRTVAPNCWGRRRLPEVELNPA